MHPNQFQVNQAWIAFRLNDAPFRIGQEGSFNCVALMDAASCFILGSALAPADDLEPSESEVRRLFKEAWEHKHEFPSTLLLPAGRFPSVVPSVAESQGISVVHVHESQLLVFIGEARQAFRERFQRGSA